MNIFRKTGITIIFIIFYVIFHFLTEIIDELNNKNQLIDQY